MNLYDRVCVCEKTYIGACVILFPCVSEFFVYVCVCALVFWRVFVCVCV